MKKYIFLAVMLLIGLNNSMANDSTTFVVNGNMYSKAHTPNKQKAEPIQTPYVYQIGGQELPILLSVNGRAYVIRISQKGNEYKYYLGEDISRDICEKMGIEYKEKEKK
jgi:hypothetical protein